MTPDLFDDNGDQSASGIELHKQIVKISQDIPAPELLRKIPSIEEPVTFAGDEEVIQMMSVTKSLRLVQGQNRLNYRQQKLLLACISLINPLASYPNGITVELDDDQISLLTKIDKRHIKSFIDRAAKAYHSIPIETPGKKPGTVDYINIAHRSVYDPELRKFTIKFHEKIEPELLNLARYTSSSLKILMELPTKYSLRFYELILSWYQSNQTGIKRFKRESMGELFFRLGVLDYKGKHIIEGGNALLTSYTLERPSLFIREILNPAIKVINELTEFRVEATYHKTRRTITAATFAITKVREQKACISEDVINAMERLNVNDLSNVDASSLLLAVGIDTKTASRLISEFDTYRIIRNLKFATKQIEDGTTIRNINAYLTHCINYDIAALPEVANPYSDRYARGDKSLKDFVYNIVCRIWWKLDPELREHLEGGLNYVPIMANIIDSYRNSGATDEAKRDALFNALFFGADDYEIYRINKNWKDEKRK